MDKLPKGRDFTTLVVQAPGANWEKKSFGLSIDGATEGENRYMVDGLETTDPVWGINGLDVVTDLVEEVQVKSSGFPAEYGGATGRVVNVLTRSGTNDWRGSAWTYFRSDGLGYPIEDRWNTFEAPAYSDGRPSLRLAFTDPTQVGYSTYPKDDVAHWEPGFSLGGPPARDRAWFFASYDPTFPTTHRTVTLAADGSVVSRRNRQTIHNAAANLSTQLGSRLRTRVAFNGGKWVSDGALPSLDGSDDPRTHYGTKSVGPSWSLSGNVDLVVSPCLYFSLRGGYVTGDYYKERIPQEPQYFFVTTNLGMAGVPEDLQRQASYANILDNWDSRKDEVSRLSLQGDVTWFKDGRLWIEDRETLATRDVIRNAEDLRGVGLDWAHRLVLSGDARGVGRVRSLRGGESHLLPGQEDGAFATVSPDGQWIASGRADGTIRLWPMPDLSKPPLHTLPHDALIAKLKSLTNLRAVPSAESPTGWQIEADPFPGWEQVPTW